MKAFVAFVTNTVPDKNTLLGSKREFVGVIRAQVGPTCTPKRAEGDIVRLGGKQFFHGTHIANDTAG